MSTATRGFGGMDKAKQRAIAAKGGKAAHARGTAHEWTAQEARAAGRIGGRMSHEKRAAAQGAAAAPAPSAPPKEIDHG